MTANAVGTVLTGLYADAWGRRRTLQVVGVLTGAGYMAIAFIDSLAGLLIVVDARRGFAERDEAMLGYAAARGIPSWVLLSKSDKLGRNDARRALAEAQAALAGRAGVQLFSAKSGEGVDAAQAALDAMLSGRVKMPGDP